MITAIHQPQYLPWLGYFDKIDRADVFVILDNVQYKKNEWQNRNRIKTVNGWQWITVPVLYKFPEKINQVRINNSADWRRKHLQSLITNYKKARFFEDYREIFEDVFSKDWEYLTKINICLIKHFINALCIKTEILTASELGCNLTDEPTERLIDICKWVGSDRYLSGKDGINYLDIERFRKEGIEVIFQDFHSPVYDQLYGPFEPDLSIIDILFNHGKGSLEIIRKQRR